MNNATHDLEKASHLELIAGCLRRSRAEAMWIAGVTGSIVLIGLVVMWWRTGVMEEQEARLRIISSVASDHTYIWAAIITGGATIGLIWSSASLLFNGRVENSELLRILKNDPEQVIWLYGGAHTYSVNGLRLPNPENSIHFGLLNGAVLAVNYIPRDRLHAVHHAATRLTPSAMCGFTKGNEDRYNKIVNESRLISMHRSPASDPIQ